MNGYSIWRMIRRYNFDFRIVACKLHGLGATQYHIGMAPGLNDVQRFDLIKHLEDLMVEKECVGKGSGDMWPKPVKPLPDIWPHPPRPDEDPKPFGETECMGGGISVRGVGNCRGETW